MKGFSGDVERFNELVQELHRRKCKSLARAVAEEVIVSTPVDTGRLRGNWQSSLNKRKYGYDKNARDPSGAEAIAAARAVLERYVMGDKFYLRNSAPYMLAIAEKGWSDQQPKPGWIKRAVTRARLREIRGFKKSGRV